MLSSKYVSINFLIDKLYREYSFVREINKPDVSEFIFDAMGFIGVPVAYIIRVTNGVEDSPDPIVIEDYRGELPCDLYKCISCRENEYKYPMVETMSTFKPSYGSDNESESMLSYYLNDNYIFTSFEEGEVEMSYSAFPTDEFGLPKIPDDVRYIKAVMSYVAERVGFKLYMQDRLSERKYERLNQDWLFYVNSAATKAHIPSYDKSESLKNQLARMIQSSNQHALGFKYLNYLERDRIHPYNR